MHNIYCNNTAEYVRAYSIDAPSLFNLKQGVNFEKAGLSCC